MTKTTSVFPTSPYLGEVELEVSKFSYELKVRRSGKSYPNFNREELSFKEMKAIVESLTSEKMVEEMLYWSTFPFGGRRYLELVKEGYI